MEKDQRRSVAAVGQIGDVGLADVLDEGLRACILHKDLLLCLCLSGHAMSGHGPPDG